MDGVSNTQSTDSTAASQREMERKREDEVFFQSLEAATMNQMMIGLDEQKEILDESEEE